MDLSIIICTFNNSESLRRTLDAIVVLDVPTGLRFEVLIVDNNSSDSTPEVASRYVKRFESHAIRSVREEKQGLAYARQRGWRETSGEYCAFVDDDCLLDSRWLIELLAFLSRHPEADIVGGKVLLDLGREPGPLLNAFRGGLAHRDLGPEDFEYPRGSYPPGAGVVVRRSAALRCHWPHTVYLTGRSGNVLTAGDDTELCERVRISGGRIFYCGRMSLFHVIPARRQSAEYLLKMVHGFGVCSPQLDILRTRLGLLWWLTFPVRHVINSARFSLLLGFKSFDSESYWRTLGLLTYNRAALVSALSMVRDRKHWSSKQGVFHRWADPSG